MSGNQIHTLLKILDEVIFPGSQYKILLIFQQLIDNSIEVQFEGGHVSKIDLTFKKEKMFKYLAKLVMANHLPSPVFSQKCLIAIKKEVKFSQMHLFSQIHYWTKLKQLFFIKNYKQIGSKIKALNEDREVLKRTELYKLGLTIFKFVLTKVLNINSDQKMNELLRFIKKRHIDLCGRFLREVSQRKESEFISHLKGLQKKIIDENQNTIIKKQINEFISFLYEAEGFTEEEIAEETPEDDKYKDLKGVFGKRN